MNEKIYGMVCCDHEWFLNKEEITCPICNREWKGDLIDDNFYDEDYIVYNWAIREES